MTKRKNPDAAAPKKPLPTGAETNVPGPRSKNSVTVACKLPHGLILRLFQFTDVSVPVLGGGTRNEKRSYQVGDSITIKGNSYPHGELPKATLVGGYALTPNVPAEFWDEWLKQNHDSDMVKNGLLFAHASPEQASDKAKEQRATKSGLERIDVRPGSKDPRLPKGVKTLTKVEDEEAA